VVDVKVGDGRACLRESYERDLVGAANIHVFAKTPQSGGTKMVLESV
jgi:hypothetical protein